jgi:hypothetical protein
MAQRYAAGGPESSPVFNGSLARARLTFLQRLINTGLQPGGERTEVAKAVSTAWPGTSRRRHGKRLKPFCCLPATNTRLKPGVNETRNRLQKIEMRPVGAPPAARPRRRPRNRTNFFEDAIRWTWSRCERVCPRSGHFALGHPQAREGIPSPDAALGDGHGRSATMTTKAGECSAALRGSAKPPYLGLAESQKRMSLACGLSGWRSSTFR